MKPLLNIAIFVIMFVSDGCFNFSDTPLEEAILYNDIGDVKKLVEKKKYDINKADVNGRTPLMIASGLGCSEIVNYLLEKGAKINTQSHQGESALIAGARYGYSEVVASLIKYGADINLRDKENKTALDYALEKQNDYGTFAKKRYEKVIELLRQHGAGIQKNPNH